MTSSYQFFVPVLILALAEAFPHQDPEKARESSTNNLRTISHRIHVWYIYLYLT